jgi:hypothetical protein
VGTRHVHQPCDNNAHASEQRACCSSCNLARTHLRAVRQGGPHAPHARRREVDVAVEGQCEQLAAQRARTQRPVQVGVRLVQQRGQERQGHLRPQHHHKHDHFKGSGQGRAKRR